jgi:hypothetical protein
MPESPPMHAAGRLQTVLLAVVFGALVLLLLAKALAVATIFYKPGEQTWPAAANAYVARRVQHGGELYGNWRVRPHVVTWYGPALYLPVAYLGRWLGSDVQGLYMIGRWVSLLSTIGTCLLIVWALRTRPAAPPTIAMVMAIVFVTADDILARFDISFRADAPACFLTMFGLVLLIRSEKPSALYGSAFAFLLAFLYKQSSITGPVAAVLWHWLSGRRRKAAHYAILSLTLFAGTAVSMNFATGGRYFLNTVQGLRGNGTFFALPFMLFEVARPAILPFTVALYVLAIETVERRWRLMTVAFAVSLVLTVASTYRDGSSVNYYMPALAMACVVCGHQLGRWWAERRASPVAATAVTLTLALASVRYVPEAASVLAESPERWRAFCLRGEQHREMADFLKRLADHLNRLRGPVLCQFNDMGLLCPNSIMIDPFTFTSMADVGAFDDRALIEQIRRGEVAAIVFDPKAPRSYQATDFFSRRWQQAMDRRYELVYKDKWAEVYCPIRHPSSNRP